MSAFLTSILYAIRRMLRRVAAGDTAMERVMPDTVDEDQRWLPTPLSAASNVGADAVSRLPALAQYGVALLLVAVATLIAFAADQVVAAPSLALIFVIPVVIAATSLGWGPSVAAVVASVLAFDFFFTQPYFTLRMTEPSEIWAAVLLLATSAIVSAVAGQSRRRALEARRMADQAQALQALAHTIIENQSQKEVIEAAATALSRIFAAPAVIFSEKEGRLRAEATAGVAVVSEVETKAAENALKAQTHFRGETYPNDDSKFDFWPVATPAAQRYVFGVDFKSSVFERTPDPERFIEIVGAYIASTRRAYSVISR
jgi:K+-sensing histidine kinase KdpD